MYFLLFSTTLKEVAVRSNLTYLEELRKKADFSRICRELLKEKEKFVPIIEASLTETHFNYENQFATLRKGGNGIISFGPEINDERFTSTEHLPSRRDYEIRVFMNTKWSTTEECVEFCKAQAGAILAGPHGLIRAIGCLGETLTACKLLVSFDKDDTKAERREQILSAGKCTTDNWALSIHRGDWAPGMFFVLFFKA